MSSVDYCLNDSVNHFILGKWVECKKANPKNVSSNCTMNNKPCDYNYYINKSKQQPHYKYKYNFRHLGSGYEPYQEPDYVKAEPQQDPISLFVYQENQEEEDNLKNGLKEKEINDINNTLFIKTDNSNNNSFLNLSNAESEKEEINSNSYNVSSNLNMEKTLLNGNNENKKSRLFQDYFNNYIKNPKFYSYFHYKLFDINGEEASSLSSYQNTTKIHLFKAETDTSTSDKDSDHSSNNSNSGSGSNGSNNFNSGSNNSNSGSSNGSGSNSNSNLCNNSNSNSSKTKTSKQSCFSSLSHLCSSNLSDSIVAIESSYKDSDEEEKDTNAYYGPRIHKKTKMLSINTFHPY